MYTVSVVFPLFSPTPVCFKCPSAELSYGSTINKIETNEISKSQIINFEAHIEKA
jgi:hypothetical protein